MCVQSVCEAGWLAFRECVQCLSLFEPLRCEGHPAAARMVRRAASGSVESITILRLPLLLSNHQQDQPYCMLAAMLQLLMANQLQQTN